MAPRSEASRWPSPQIPHPAFSAWPQPAPGARGGKTAQQGPEFAVASVLRPQITRKCQLSRGSASRPSAARSPRNRLGEAFAAAGHRPPQRRGKQPRQGPDRQEFSLTEGDPALKTQGIGIATGVVLRPGPPRGHPDDRPGFQLLFEICSIVQKVPARVKFAFSFRPLTNAAFRPSQSRGSLGPGAVGAGSAESLARGDRGQSQRGFFQLQASSRSQSGSHHLLKLATQTGWFPRPSDPPAARPGAAAPGRTRAARQRQKASSKAGQAVATGRS